MREQESFFIKNDNEEVAATLDTFTKIAETKVLQEDMVRPLIASFYFVNGKVAVIPLLTDSPEIAWENENLQQALFQQAYEEMHEERMNNLIIIFPSVMYLIPDKSQISVKLKKKESEITAHDMKLVKQLYPELVQAKYLVQFFIDIGGEFYHAHAEVVKQNQLAEYVVSPTATISPIVIKLHEARSRVFVRI